MRDWVYGFFMAWGMFLAIPCPKKLWSETARRKMLVCLPLVGLLVGGIVISALGAVMDVTMGIASSLSEVHAANPELSRRELFRSGMNIGQDAMGTMANTLILAFAGSSLNTLLLFQIFDYPMIQIFNADSIAIEIIRGVAGTIGIILTVPLVALLSAEIMGPKKNA